MLASPQTVAPTTPSTTTAAANTAVVKTLAAAAGVYHEILRVDWSYSAAPTGGNLLISIDGTNVFDLDITAGGPGHVDFGYGAFYSGANEAVVLTLAAGGGTVVGTLNVVSR